MTSSHYDISLYRCVWHLFTQDWSSLPGRSKLTEDGKTLVTSLGRWIGTWIFTLKHEHQFLDSLQKFKDYIPTQKKTLGSSMFREIMKVVGVLEETSTKWALCYKKPVLDREQCTSSIGESANSSLKRFSKSLHNKSLSNSADSQLKHSQHLQEKRDASAAESMTLSFVQTIMEDQHLLTLHCLELSREIYDRRYHYMVIRDTKLSYLVCHRNTFVANGTEVLADLNIPRYSNAYRVSIIQSSIGTTDSLYMKCTCFQRARKGIPCEHVTSVLGKMHPQMFHPIYLSSYNSWIYDSSEFIRRSLEPSLKFNDENPNLCDITGLFEVPDWNGNIVSQGNSDGMYVRMRSLENMILQGKPLIRGDEPEIMEQVSEENDSAEFEHDDYDYSLGEEDRRKNRKRTVGVGEGENVQCMNLEYKVHSFLESWSKDMIKATNDDDQELHDLMKTCKSLLNKAVGRQMKRQKIEQSQKDSAIVSSCAETETSKKSGRMKRSYERK